MAEFKHGEDILLTKVLQETKIKEIMTKEVISLHEDEPFSLVEEKFRRYQIRHLPIINYHKEVVGIVTQRDLYRIQSPRMLEDGTWYYDQKSLDQHILSVVMTKDPKTLGSHDSIGQAIEVMVRQKVGAIPIVEQKVLCGIVTRHDILKIPARFVYQ